MIRYYKPVETSSGHIYSLDMLRLKLEFGNEVEEFVIWFNKKYLYGSDIDCKHWVSFKIYSYRDMFNIILNESSFVMAIGYNGNSGVEKIGFMEFNPNKCRGNKNFEEILSKLYSYCLSVQVVRYDLAIDIPINRYYVRLKKDNRNYQYISGRSETEYLGVRSHVGFVKLYDKKNESNLDYDLTRLEITCNLDGINFPEVFITQIQNQIIFDDKLSATDKVLIDLLKQVDNPYLYLNKLVYRKRKKIEKYLYENKIELDKKAYYEIKMQVLEYQK